MKITGRRVRAVVVVAAAMAVIGASAFERYNDGCNECHGKFTDATSTKGSKFPGDSKHEMHRHMDYMNTDCGLCHSAGDAKNPFTGSSDGAGTVPGLGCTGCHNAVGLRKHHIANDINVCATAECHDDTGITPPGEQFNPPYYGTAYTRANQACNLVRSVFTNENWTTNDFVGIDNDGDNVYDDNGPSCGLRVVTLAKTGTPVSISFNSIQGIRYRVDTGATLLPAAWSGLATNLLGTGLDIGVADGAAGAATARYYRVLMYP